MKCKNCGAEAVQDAKFCYNCGAEIKTAHNFCANCGSKLEPGDKFCSTCGQSVESDVWGDEKPKKPEKVKSRSNYARRDDRITNLIFYGSIFLALLFLFVYFYTTQGVKRQDNVSRGTASIEVAPEIEAKVYEVASKFVCGCGQCGELPLEKCDCGSAIQEKNFIREQLLKGELIENVIVMVNQTYGNLKPEFRDKFGRKLELK